VEIKRIDLDYFAGTCTAQAGIKTLELSRIPSATLARENWTSVIRMMATHGIAIDMSRFSACSRVVSVGVVEIRLC
jgi:hypothetical protein